MGIKRNSMEADLYPVSTRHEESKRTRLSPTADDTHSNPSTHSLSVTSGVNNSSPSASVETRRTSVSDQDDESEVSSSDPSTSSDDEDLTDNEGPDVADPDVATGSRATARGITEVESGSRQIHIDPQRLKHETENLLNRLREFMPKLIKANSDLQHVGGKSMEDVQDGEAHIEMDLGLGVLEEKKGGVGADDDDGESSDDDEGGGCEGKDTAVLRKLMGDRGERVKPEIQEVNSSKVVNASRPDC